MFPWNLKVGEEDKSEFDKFISSIKTNYQIRTILIIDLAYHYCEIREEDRDEIKTLTDE